MSGWIYEMKEEDIAAFMPLEPRSIYQAFEKELHLDLVLTPLKTVGKLSRVIKLNLANSIHPGLSLNLVQGKNRIHHLTNIYI
jgi:hypothetical protein